MILVFSASIYSLGGSAPSGHYGEPAGLSRRMECRAAWWEQSPDWTLARRQQAKLLERRAAMSLSRLWQKRGKRAETYDLQPCVSVFQFTKVCDMIRK